MKYMAVLILWISLVSTYKVPGNCHNPCQMHRTPEAAFKKGEKGKLWQSLQKMISKCDLSHILLIYSLSLSLSHNKNCIIHLHNIQLNKELKVRGYSDG